MPNYKESIKSLKKEGSGTVSYARKPPKKDDNIIKVLLTQKMIIFFARSLCTMVYISASSCASDPSHERGLKINFDVYVKLENVDGTTQGEKWRKYTHTCYSVSLTNHLLDTLEHFQASDHNIWLVGIGFARLTSNCHHAKELLERSLCIDGFNDSSRLHTFDPDHLIANSCKNLTAEKKLV